MGAKVNPDSTWLTGRQARLRGGGLTPTALLKLAAIGRVKTLALPGEAIKYAAADIDRLATAPLQQQIEAS